MARYINANEIRYHQKENIDGYVYSEYVSKDEIDAIPVADVEPVRRGKWLENEYRHYCSECGHMGLFNGFGFKLESNYCPHCGAKMEEYKSDIT